MISHAWNSISTREFSVLAVARGHAEHEGASTVCQAHTLSDESV